MHLYDAHNHLQDARFGGRQEELVAACRAEGVVAMIVNGACEQDWPEVAILTSRFPGLVRPSYGYHPWYVAERTPVWREALVRLLEQHPGAAIGEIGLDRWKPGLDLPAQEEVFMWQLRLAAERGLPASIHCLQAWGRMFDLLRAGPRPDRGFLLHAYGGPEEMVAPLAGLGAYFSLPGYYAHERKHRQCAAFKAVPRDRLLIETDAPDQCLPTGQAGEEGGAEVRRGIERYALRDPRTGRALNHPANLRAVYEFAAALRGEPLAALAADVEANFLRLFGTGG